MSGVRVPLCPPSLKSTTYNRIGIRKQGAIFAFVPNIVPTCQTQHVVAFNLHSADISTSEKVTATVPYSFRFRVALLVPLWESRQSQQGYAMENQRMYKVTEFADALNLSPKTIWSFIYSGKIESCSHREIGKDQEKRTRQTSRSSVASNNRRNQKPTMRHSHRSKSSPLVVFVCAGFCFCFVPLDVF